MTAKAISTTLSMDELFRQKTLQEIHTILRKTRSDVEAKKQELRELVGDHYRSILESSDHIRAMSERASEVSAGADKLASLVTSMQSLAAELPSTSSKALADRQVQARSNPEYRLNQRVMAVLEVPDKVRGHLSDFKFVQAARLALVELLEEQREVEALMQEQKSSHSSSFDYTKLMQQQAAVVRSLPQQIAASCVDAFRAPSLSASSAVECFAMRLLLDPTAQPASMLQVFLDQRRELLATLLDGSSRHQQTAADATRCGTRLASAALAFEGTIVLSARLTGSGGNEARLVTALNAALEGARDRSNSEERAAIEGRRDTGSTSLSALQKRAEALCSSLKPGGTTSVTLAQELAVKGSALARGWMPEGAQAAPEGLQSSFVRLASSLASVSARTGSTVGVPSCALLGEVIEACTDKIYAYRRSLSGVDTLERWPSTWSEACSRFCPSRGPLQDALSILNSTMEVVCAEVVRERVGGLQLELLPSASDEEAEATASASGHAEASEAQRCAEITEMRRQSKSRLASFSEQLGEVLEDLAASTHSQDLPLPVVLELVKALRARLTVVCESVQLPAPYVPAADADKDAIPWNVQRGAARAAIAFDVLLAAASSDSADSSSESSHLRAALKMAYSYGDAQVASEAQSLLEALRQRSDSAFRVWASFTAMPRKGFVPLEAFWQWSDDEVSTACGWGSAKFTRGGDGGQAMRSVPVPVQASPFVFERLTVASRRALEVSGAGGLLPKALVAALKAALSDSFLAAYNACQIVDLDKQKTGGMAHLLQWLFDLRFLRIVLSSGDGTSFGASSRSGAGNTDAYEAICKLLDRIEAATLSDPVDRLLYQEVLKASVKLHIDGVKVLLSPLFMYNPLYAFLFPGRTAESALEGAVQPQGTAAQEDDGFEIPPAFAPPLRTTLPRFPLLPVATASSHASVSHLDPRLGLGTEADRARAAAAAAASGAASGGKVSSLMQQFGSGLESLGFGKAFGGGTSFWTNAQQTSAPPTGAPRVPKVPQAV